MRKHYRWWATAAALVIGLIFVSVQQTSARWTAAETLSGGTIQSGILDLTVGSAGSGQSSYDFTALGATGMFPNAYAQAPLTVHNSGNVPLNYRIQNVTQSSADVPLSLAVTPVASEAGCPAQGAADGTAIYDGPMVGAQVPTAPGWRTVAAGSTDILCLRGTVGPDVASGVSTSVHFSFEAESV